MSDPEKPYFEGRFQAQTAAIMQLQEANERRRSWPENLPGREPWTAAQRAEHQGRMDAEGGRAFPENAELLAAIRAKPDDDEPRRAYARWMEVQPQLIRTVPNQHLFSNAETMELPGGVPTGISTFIDGQLRAAQGYRADPRFDPTPIIRTYFGRTGTLNDWRFGRPVWGAYDLGGLAGESLVDAVTFYRGFVEHVAMKAEFFLRFAEELYSQAPIRHLTLTYCGEHMAALAASPHLARIKTLCLFNRMENNHYIRLNDLTDDHIRILASSPHLRDLRQLDLEDNTALTPRAFDYLAVSPNLPALSEVRHDIYLYGRTLGEFGDFTKTLSERRSERWRAEIEARHGFLPWLHAEELYGTPTPDIEAVTEHPVGLASFRPDIAARRRPALPDAIADRQ